jgi:CHAD domain-containing protein
MTSTGAEDAPEEVELKYAVTDPDAVRAALDGSTLTGIEAGPWRTVQLEDRYVDTRDGALERAGYGARLRRVDGRTVLTVKSIGRGDSDDGGLPRSLHRRLEMEAPAHDRLDPARWPDSQARELVERIVAGERLRTLFVVHQRRHERDLTPVGDPSPAATLSLDAADVRRRGQTAGSFGTLEVESTDGSSGFLARLAPVLESTGLLQPEVRSKEEIARELVRAASARRAAPVPRRPGVRADDTLSEAGRKVLRMHYLRMRAAEPGTRSGEDTEDLHKMRVATRRMRAVWRVFDGAYRRKPQKRYVAELRAVAGALGGVRDLDVQLEGLAAHRAGLRDVDDAALEPLAEEWRRRRERVRTKLLQLLDSPTYERFVDDYGRFVETPEAGAVALPPGSPLRVRDNAAGRIWRAYEVLRAHDVGLRWADVPALHAVRIDAKRLRYTIESFAEVLPPETAQLIAAVVAVQDQLGALNDAQVAADLTRGWLIASAPWLAAETRDVAGAYLADREREVARLRRTLPPVWRRVSGPAFTRRLGVVLSSL